MNVEVSFSSVCNLLLQTSPRTLQKTTMRKTVKIIITFSEDLISFKAFYKETGVSCVCVLQPAVAFFSQEIEELKSKKHLLKHWLGVEGRGQRLGLVI